LGRRIGPRPLALYLQLALLMARRPGAVAAMASDRVDPEHFLRGLHAYWRHPFRRRVAEPPAVWQEGSARLLDYGAEGKPPVLVLPSLINRPYILDLLEERSLLRFLARSGFRPLLLDWGQPEGAELAATVADHVFGRAEAALDIVRAITGRPPTVLGYCMGGLLACALSAARQSDLAGLALLATPWDFRAGRAEAAATIAATLLPLTLRIGTLGYASVEALQSFFAVLDPVRVIGKFQRFADLPPGSPRAGLFVAVEDWLNDGVPLAGPVAQECLWRWYVENQPARGFWAPGGVPVRPEELTLPALVAIPSHDRIVPAGSAEPLAAKLPDATVIRPSAGHVSMVVGERAPEQLWQPLAAWLRRIAPRRSSCLVRPASAIA
jgi:polyhydroxyalkanoate synthase